MARREYQCPSVLEREGRQGREWYIRYRVRVIRMVDGKPTVSRVEKWHSLGLCKDLTKRQAERERDRIMREVNAQVYTVQSQIPFAEFVHLFRENYVPTLAAPTRANYEQWLTNYITPYFGTMRLSDVKPLHVEQFLQQLPLAPLTKRTIRGLLASVFTRAAEWGYATTPNPARHVGKQRKSPQGVRRKVLLTPEQLQLLMAAVNDDVRLMIATQVITGMRVSECLGLTPHVFDFERGHVLIEQRQCRGDIDSPKSQKGYRVLPLTPSLVAEYRKRCAGLGPSELVFRREDGTPYADNALLANYLSPIMKRLGLKQPGMGWHSFRRLNATWFSEEAATPYEVMQQLGHSSVEQSQAYIVPNIRRRADTAARVESRLYGAVPSGKPQ